MKLDVHHSHEVNAEVVRFKPTCEKITELRK